MRKKIDYIQKAIKLCGGTQKRFADEMRVTQQAVSKWLYSGVIPPRNAARAEKVTGIPRKRFNPRIFA